MSLQTFAKSIVAAAIGAEPVRNSAESQEWDGNSARPQPAAEPQPAPQAAAPKRREPEWKKSIRVAEEMRAQSPEAAIERQQQAAKAAREAALKRSLQLVPLTSAGRVDIHRLVGAAGYAAPESVLAEMQKLVAAYDENIKAVRKFSNQAAIDQAQALRKTALEKLSIEEIEKIDVWQKDELLLDFAAKRSVLNGRVKLICAKAREIAAPELARAGSFVSLLAEKIEAGEKETSESLGFGYQTSPLVAYLKRVGNELLSGRSSDLAMTTPADFLSFLSPQE